MPSCPFRKGRFTPTVQSCLVSKRPSSWGLSGSFIFVSHHNRSVLCSASVGYLQDGGFFILKIHCFTSWEPVVAMLGLYICSRHQPVVKINIDSSIIDESVNIIVIDQYMWFFFVDLHCCGGCLVYNFIITVESYYGQFDCSQKRKLQIRFVCKTDEGKKIAFLLSGISDLKHHSLEATNTNIYIENNIYFTLGDRSEVNQLKGKEVDFSHTIKLFSLSLTCHCITGYNTSRADYEGHIEQISGGELLSREGQSGEPMFIRSQKVNTMKRYKKKKNNSDLRSLISRYVGSSHDHVFWVRLSSQASCVSLAHLDKGLKYELYDDPWSILVADSCFLMTRFADSCFLMTRLCRPNTVSCSAYSFRFAENFLILFYGSCVMSYLLTLTLIKSNQVLNMNYLMILGQTSSRFAEILLSRFDGSCVMSYLLILTLIKSNQVLNMNHLMILGQTSSRFAEILLSRFDGSCVIQIPNISSTVLSEFNYYFNPVVNFLSIVYIAEIISWPSHLSLARLQCKTIISRFRFIVRLLELSNIGEVQRSCDLVLFYYPRSDLI
ncbi:hypothetical protein KUTeg_001167 [Tegillarca granosa]|uniref:Uncharacterized protein n=1 Tax=Tegillarca granosa TaxID=220873 RepID=A0ABQ9FVP5_TEGGR|nr:hypothetical protein KUTeg_001167 [Tegillarca granosa]